MVHVRVRQAGHAALLIPLLHLCFPAWLTTLGPRSDGKLRSRLCRQAHWSAPCTHPALPCAAGPLQLGKGGKVVKITGIQDKGRTATVLLRGSNKLALAEADRSLHDALCVVRCLVQVGLGAGHADVGGQRRLLPACQASRRSAPACIECTLLVHC